MTRPRCPKCHKYYVTQMFEQRPLPSRTADAIMRSLRREPAPLSPYRRYSCDICGHRWAVLVTAVTQPPKLPTATEPVWSARTIPTGSPSYARAPSRSGATYPGGRSGTLMAAHPAASQRLRRAAASNSTVAYRVPTQRATYPAHLAATSASVAVDIAEVPVPLDMEPLDEAPTSRWQELWRFILPS